MIKRINTNELITSDLLVTEPIDKFEKELKEHNSSKIILSNGRGTGKSVILKSYEQRTINTPNPCIYTSFDACGFGTYFETKFYIHYYELIFADKLLTFLKKYYGKIYETYFIKYQEELNAISKDTDNFINNSIYTNTPLPRYLLPFEHSSKIVKDIKKYLPIENLTISIDRFDWTNQSDETTQKILRDYFILFDKVIITSDSEQTKNPHFINMLEHKGYSFIDTLYGNDINIIKSLVTKRLDQYDREKPAGYTYFNHNLLTDDIYNYLIQSCNSNITLIINIINKIISDYHWYQDMPSEKEIELLTKDQIEQNHKVRKMSKEKKLYL